MSKANKRQQGSSEPDPEAFERLLGQYDEAVLIEAYLQAFDEWIAAGGPPPGPSDDLAQERPEVAELSFAGRAILHRRRAMFTGDDARSIA